jgi:hypothetical protein
MACAACSACKGVIAELGQLQSDVGQSQLQSVMADQLLARGAPGLARDSPQQPEGIFTHAAAAAGPLQQLNSQRYESMTHQQAVYGSVTAHAHQTPQRVNGGLVAHEESSTDARGNGGRVGAQGRGWR